MLRDFTRGFLNLVKTAQIGVEMASGILKAWLFAAFIQTELS